MSAECEEPRSPLLEAWKVLEPELSKESDRGCAVLAGAYLDDLLGEVLKAYLIENDDAGSDLLSSENVNAPLGSFGSRILAAYAVGLLDRKNRDAMRKIKTVRNRFAHDMHLTLDDPKISKLCADMFALCFSDKEKPNPRDNFHLVVSFMGGNLSCHINILAETKLNAGFKCLTSLAASYIGKENFAEFLRRHGWKFQP